MKHARVLLALGIATAAIAAGAQWMEKVSDGQYGAKDATTCKTPKT